MAWGWQRLQSANAENTTLEPGQLRVVFIDAENSKENEPHSPESEGDAFYETGEEPFLRTCYSRGSGGVGVFVNSTWL